MEKDKGSSILRLGSLSEVRVPWRTKSLLWDSSVNCCINPKTPNRTRSFQPNLSSFAVNLRVNGIVECGKGWQSTQTGIKLSNSSEPPSLLSTMWWICNRAGAKRLQTQQQRPHLARTWSATSDRIAIATFCRVAIRIFPVIVCGD